MRTISFINLKGGVQIPVDAFHTPDLRGRVPSARPSSCSPTVHELKIDPEYFRAFCQGLKPWEIRRDDRRYSVGDILLLREYQQGSYSGNAVHVKVKYIFHSGQEETA